MPLPELVSHEVTVRGLDARHDGLRIAHLTDLHCGRMTPSRHILHALRLAEEAKPDVIAMTGDYVSWALQEVTVMEELLQSLGGAPVFATLGNHDYYTSGRHVEEALGRCGHTVLKNESVSLDVRGASLRVIGVDDPVTRKADLDLAFRGVSGSGTRLVLCHCPETVDGIAERGADLVLSGHTHGGQINVRGITDRIFMKSGKRFFRAGHYRVDATNLYVNPGIGFSGVPVRAGAGTRAEVALVVLRAGE